MSNNFIGIGRIAKIEKQEERAILTIAIPRSYKNENGEYETDFVPCILWNGVAENTFNYCQKGDMVGVKGRIQSNENGIELIAEKVTFLSSKKEDE